MTEEYEYAKRLAESLAREHWPENTGWEPLPDLLGVLTQLDNMTTLMRDQKIAIAMAHKALAAMITVAETRTAEDLVNQHPDLEPVREYFRRQV